MAITFVNAGSFGSGTNAVTAGAVASVQADDLLLLFVETANQPIAAPSGWTQVTGSPVAIGTANAAGGVSLQVFYQWATGADSNTSVVDSGDHTTAVKLAYRGVDKSVPFDATPVSGTKTTASTSSSFPSITTATANAWVILASALDLDAASTATTSGYTNAALASITERVDQTIAGGFGGGLVIADAQKAAAGSTGATTATVTSTTQVYLTIALRAKQLLTASLYDDGTDTFYAPTVAVGAVNLTPPLVTNDQTFYTPTVTGSTPSQSLAASLYTNDQTFYTPTVAAKYSLSAGLYTNSSSLFAPTVAPGAVTLAPTLFNNSSTLYSPTVTPGPVTLSHTLYSNSQTIYTPTVSPGAVQLTPSLVTNSQTFYGAAVASGAYPLAPSLVTNDQTFYSAAVTLSSAQLAPSLVTNSQTFYSATITQAQGVLPSLYTNGQTFYSAQVAPGPVQLSASLATNTNFVYLPTVSASYQISFSGYADPGYVADGYDSSAAFNETQVFSPVVNPGPVQLQPSKLTNSQQFFTAKVVKSNYALTLEQARLLYQIYLLHGLESPLVVSQNARSSGEVVQTVDEVNGNVTITTTSQPDVPAADPGLMIEELAALHGITAPLVVTPSGRAAGSITQVFGQSGNATTVTRQ